MPTHPPSAHSGRHVLVLVGHPRAGSFCAALAHRYVDGARSAAMDVELIDLSSLSFDPDVHPSSPTRQALEPDLETVRLAIERADHLAIFHPAWWGTWPARLKGLLDRVLLPGFAFRETAPGRYDRLLAGRTAHLVCTIDMPPWVYRFIYRSPGVTALRRSILGFCGIRVTRVLLLGPVAHSTASRRDDFLDRARRLGASLSHGPAGRSGATKAAAGAWLRAIRGQFHPPAWMAYAVGAMMAAPGPDGITWTAGWIALLLLEIATVLTNERFDIETDRLNVHHSLFTGGSRILVDGVLTERQVMRVAGACTVGAFAMAGLAVDRLAAVGAAGHAPLAAAGWFAVLAVMALGYTVPPVRLSWRTLGELDVGLTHSIGVLLWGWLLQGGQWNEPAPWRAALPMGLAIVPAIVLSGIPDHDADRAVGKRTLAVRLGIRRALLVAVVAAVAAGIAALAMRTDARFGFMFDGIAFWTLPLGAALVWSCLRERRHGDTARRIDGLMAVALGYSLPFIVVPLVNLFVH